MSPLPRSKKQCRRGTRRTVETKTGEECGRSTIFRAGSDWCNHGHIAAMIACTGPEEGGRERRQRMGGRDRGRKGREEGQMDGRTEEEDMR